MQQPEPQEKSAWQQQYQDALRAKKHRKLEKLAKELGFQIVDEQ